MIKNIQVKQRVLSTNDKNANILRDFYKKHNKFVINLMSSPGSGKTTMLENLAQFDDFRFCVIEGDLQTKRDADRLEKKGILARQITTGAACHLEAKMIIDMLDSLQNDDRFYKSDFIVIENVGNLVCPASYDLGANINIVLLSTPEGDDKVLKYPSMFLCADIVLITKSDIKQFFNFDIHRVKNDLQTLRNNIDLFEISSKDVKTLEFIKNKFLNLKNQNFMSNFIFK